MNTFIKGIAFSYALMGYACLVEPMPLEFIQHMVGLILLTLALIIWNNKWK